MKNFKTLFFAIALMISASSTTFAFGLKKKTITSFNSRVRRPTPVPKRAYFARRVPSSSQTAYKAPRAPSSSPNTYTINLPRLSYYGSGLTLQSVLTRDQGNGTNWYFFKDLRGVNHVFILKQNTISDNMMKTFNSLRKTDKVGFLIQCTAPARSYSNWRYYDNVGDKTNSITGCLLKYIKKEL